MDKLYIYSQDVTIHHIMTDREVVSAQFKEVHGRDVCWANPQAYNEKLQVFKLQDSTEKLSPFVDKYEVRSYVFQASLLIIKRLSCVELDYSDQEQL